MIGLALSLAARFTSSPRTQKVLAWIILAATVGLVLWLAWLLFWSWVDTGKRAAVEDDRKSATIDAVTIQRDADNSAAWFDQSAAIERERGKAEAMEAINASVRDPDGDPLGSAFDELRRQEARAKGADRNTR